MKNNTEPTNTERQLLMREIAFEKSLFANVLQQANISYVLYNDEWDVSSFWFCTLWNNHYASPDRLPIQIKQLTENFNTQEQIVVLTFHHAFWKIKLKEIELVQDYYYLLTIENLSGYFDNDLRRVFFEKSTFALLYIGSQHQVVDANLQFIKNFGALAAHSTIEQFRNRPFYQALIQALDNNEPITQHNFLEHNKWWNLTINTIADNDAVIGALAYFEDVTGQKNNNDAIAQQHVLYEYFFNESPVGIFFYDKHLKITHLNGQFSKIVNIPSANLIGLDMSQIKDTRVLPALNDALAGKFGEYLGHYRTTYGNYHIYVSLKTFPLYADKLQKQLVGAVAILSDLTKEHQIEEQLKFSEKQFEVAFENSPDAISVSEMLSGKYVKINKGFETLSGYHKNQVLNKTSIELGIWKSETDRINYIRDIKAHGYVSNRELKLVLEGNQERTMLLTSHIIVLNNEQYLLTIARDVEELKRLEQKALEAKARYQTYFNEAPDGIAVIDENFRLQNANAMFCENTDLTPNNFIKHRLPELYDDQFVWQKYKEELNLNGKTKFEIRKKNKNNNFIWVLIDIVRVNVEEFLVFEKNINQRKTIENRYKQFKDISDSSNIGHVVVGQNNQISYINNHYAYSLGYSPDEMIGHKITDFFSSEQQQKLREVTLRLQNKLKINSEIVWHQKRNLEKVPMLVSGIVVKQENHDSYVTISAINIAEQIELENSLRNAMQKAKEADYLKTAFLSNMSHEIRTPMNGILGFAEILKDPDLSHELRVEYIEFIDRSGQYLLEIIDDIIDIAKIEANQLRIFKNNFNLVELLQSLQNFFDLAKKQRNKAHLKIIADIPDQKLDVFSDKTRINQIFMNLIGNALKFTHQGSITFGYKNIGATNIQCYVKDTGIGIAPDQQHVIFDRFRQAEDFMSKQFEGTGLGLSISRGLVEMLGGQIWLESVPDKGSTFYFTIQI